MTRHGQYRLVVATAVCVLLAGARAERRTWDGGGDGILWVDPNNWDPNGVPDPNDDMVITWGWVLAASHHYVQLRSGSLTVDGVDAAAAFNYPQFDVGYLGDGAVTVCHGGGLSSQTSYLGGRPGGRGAVTVAGAGSSWTTNNCPLTVGCGGGGTLEIGAGGQVLDGNAFVGWQTGSDGEVTVSGSGGGEPSRWAHSRDLFLGGGYYFDGTSHLGGAGTGTLSVSDGAEVTDRNAYVAYHQGSTGRVTIDGASWTHTNVVYVGYGATGTLDVLNGGAVTGWEGRVGCDANADGRVAVDGDGSSWSSHWALYVGLAGTGTLEIARGGSVRSCGLGGEMGTGGGHVGYAGSGVGTVTVDDANWLNDDDLYVGHAGRGTLDVVNGGAVRVTGRACVAHDANAVGTVTVGGAGSTWTVAGSAYVGGGPGGAGGEGLLELRPGGWATVGGDLKVWPGGTLRPAGGTVEVAGELATTGTLSFGLGRCFTWGYGEPGTYAWGGLALGGALELTWLPTPGDANSKFGGWYDLIVYRGGVSGGLAVCGELAAYFEGIDYQADLGEGFRAVRIKLGDLIDGDCNLDGNADGADLLAIEAGMGLARPGWSDGDFNFDGVVDHLDFLSWKASADAMPPGAAEVPAPAALWLLAVGAGALPVRRRR